MNWEGKVVLVTGGTGSFGTAFVRLLLDETKISALRVFSRDELKQWEMQRRFDDDRLRFLLGDVRDRERLTRAFEGVDVVVHAAALKQVTACEYNPNEAVKTNVLGSSNVVDAAIDAGVRRVMAISTDKAVNPVNIYGATKLCAEKLIVQGNAYSGARPTRLSVVRYGNVLGSRGSVVPFFLERRESGVLPITDRRMTRFWITLPQAASFVRRSIERMNGGETFVPKIPSVHLTDCALAIAPNARMIEVGIRPGEKLHEVLITEEEARHTYEYDDHFVVQPEHRWWTATAPESGATDGGRALPEGYRYSSDSYPDRLPVTEIASLIRTYEQSVAVANGHGEGAARTSATERLANA